MRDCEGNLFGTTDRGGAYGFATVYKLDTEGNEIVLYSFTGASAGPKPQASLLLDAEGNLYGTASAGGSAGNGTVFKIQQWFGHRPTANCYARTASYPPYGRSTACPRYGSLA